MSMLSSVISDVLHFAKIILICEFFFKFEKYDYKNKIISRLMIVFIVLVTSVFIFIEGYEIIDLLLYFVVICLIFCLLYKEKINEIIMSALWIIFLLSMIDMLSKIFARIVFNLFGWKSDNVAIIMTSVLSLMFVAVLVKLYNLNYNESIKNIGIINLFGFTMLSLVDTFVVMVMAVTVLDETQGKHRILFSIAFIGVILGIFIQLAAVILLFAQKNLHESRENIAIKYLNEQKRHYEYLENRETQTKRFRHDLKKHMEMLNVLAKSNKYDEFDEYLEKINIKIDTFGKAITVHDGIVDAVVNQYYSKAVDNGIIMNVSGRFPTDCGINAFDLCTIFSNVLSNAVEAAVESEEKTIDVQFRYTRKSIIVDMKNSYKNVGQFSSGKMKSMKKDMNYHGFGLGNIKETIEKYNGVLDIDITDSEFKVKILLGYAEKEGI